LRRTKERGGDKEVLAVFHVGQSAGYIQFQRQGRSPTTASGFDSYEHTDSPQYKLDLHSRAVCCQWFADCCGFVCFHFMIIRGLLISLVCCGLFLILVFRISSTTLNCLYLGCFLCFRANCERVVCTDNLTELVI